MVPEILVTSAASPNPMRFAGTCRQYSKKATPQLTRMAAQSGAFFASFRWPYQA